MTLEDKFKQHDQQVVDKYHAPNADYEMSTRDYVLRPSADGDSGAITITLPPVAAAKGRFYSIIARNADAVNTITIQDLDDSECWPGDLTMNGKCDRALLYSDGLSWHNLTAVMGGWGSTTYPPGTSAPPTTLAPTTAAGQGTTAAPTTLATTAAPTTLATTAAPTTVA